MSLRHQAKFCHSLINQCCSNFQLWNLHSTQWLYIKLLAAFWSTPNVSKVDHAISGVRLTALGVQKHMLFYGVVLSVHVLNCVVFCCKLHVIRWWLGVMLWGCRCHIKISHNLFHKLSWYFGAQVLHTKLNFLWFR